MKKIYFLFALLLVGSFSFAQRSSDGIEKTYNRSQVNVAGKVTAIDTVFPEVWVTQSCAASPALYSSSGGGYVVGGNAYGDLAKAQRIDLTGGFGTVSEVLVAFGGKIEADSMATLYSSIHEVDGGTGGPSTLIQTGDNITMGDVDTTGNWTVFPYTTPANVSVEFFVNIVNPTSNGDTVGIITTQDPCQTGPNLWEQWSDNSWFAISDATNSFGLEIEALIAPVVDIQGVGTEEAFVQRNGFKLYGISPNPAVSNTMIDVEVDKASGVMVQILDANGRLVKAEDYGMLQAGRHHLSLDVSTIANGTYFYTVVTTQGSLAGKVMVAH